MKNYCITLLLLLVVTLAKAQSGTGSGDIKAGWGTLDYAVPESPASKILSTSPDQLLKPTSVRNVALNVANYFFSSGSVIPKNVSVELAPLLLNGKASLNAYNQNRFFYRMRFSFATGVQSNGGYQVAEGLRFTLVDKSDLRDFKSNPGFADYLYNAAMNNSVAIGKAIDLYILQNPSAQLIPITAREKYATDSVFRQTIDGMATQFYDQAVNIDKLSAYRDSIKNALWNAPIWDVGIAAVQSSIDSLVKNLTFTKIGVWSTAGVPIGKKGQLLIGATASVVDSISWQANVSIGERLYYGTNNLRGFIQAQYDYKNQLNGFTGSLGCQFNIGNGIWGDFSLNLVVDGYGRLSYQPGLHFAVATPEKKKT